jgi:uncharacterized protein
MRQAQFRFYAELNDHLPPERNGVDILHLFQSGATVKDRIEVLGVPHTEVDLILANGRSVGFSYLVQDGDRISVYPVFESIDISPLLLVRPIPLRDPRFVLDGHLGRLAAYLRLLGFDTLYRNDYGDAELARIERDDKRILLTRDRGLLKRASVERGYYVRETKPREQVVEALRRFDLFGSIQPFRRCLDCNGLLDAIEKGAVADRLLPGTREEHDEFQICESCSKIYWKGSHYARMLRFVEAMEGRRQ